MPKTIFRLSKKFLFKILNTHVRNSGPAPVWEVDIFASEECGAILARPEDHIVRDA